MGLFLPDVFSLDILRFCCCLGRGRERGDLGFLGCCCLLRRFGNSCTIAFMPGSVRVFRREISSAGFRFPDNLFPALLTF